MGCGGREDGAKLRGDGPSTSMVKGVMGSVEQEHEAWGWDEEAPRYLGLQVRPQILVTCNGWNSMERANNPCSRSWEKMIKRYPRSSMGWREGRQHLTWTHVSWTSSNAFLPSSLLIPRPSLVPLSSGLQHCCLQEDRRKGWSPPCTTVPGHLCLLKLGLFHCS